MTTQIHNNGEAALSAPPRGMKAPRALTPDERVTILAVADALIPQSGTNPQASDASGYEEWLQRAIDARAEQFDDLVEALSAVGGLSGEPLFARLRDFSGEDPLRFQVLSAIVAGAYLMVPEVKVAIGYPGQRRNPLKLEEAIDQISDGILDPVIERGSIYVAPAE